MTNWLKHDMEEAMREVNRLLLENLELQEDAELLMDMVEGSTSFNEVMSRVLDKHLEASSQAKAVKEREADLKARRERLEGTADGLKTMMMAMMKTAGTEKVVLTEATLSITKPRTSVNVLDVDALEQPFYVLSRVADKKKIKEAIEAGQIVDGAILQMGEPSLSVRTK